MNFDQLQRRVERAESVVGARLDIVECQWGTLKHAWKRGWTPTRIVVAGLVSGFLVGRAEPMKAMNGTRWLQMITSISGLVASLQANVAAKQAESAANSAEDTAAETSEAVGVVAAVADATDTTPAAVAPPRPVAAEPATAPRPAEAATELSER